MTPLAGERREERGEDNGFVNNRRAWDNRVIRRGKLIQGTKPGFIHHIGISAGNPELKLKCLKIYWNPLHYLAAVSAAIGGMEMTSLESRSWEDLNLDNSFWKLIFNDFSDLFPAIAALLAISISLSAVFLDNFLSFSRNNDNTNSGRNYKIPLWKISRLVWPKKYFCPCATKKFWERIPELH